MHRVQFDALFRPTLRGLGYMIAKTYTCSLLGIDAVLMEVGVDLAGLSHKNRAF